MNVNIILVEDDPVALNLYESYLNNIDKACVRTCSSGTKALECAEDFQVDIAVLDYHLPDICGLELISMLILKYPDMIVISISADESKELETEVLEMGAVSFIKKPVNSRVFILTVNNFARIIKHRKEIMAKVKELPSFDSEIKLMRPEPKSPDEFFAETETAYCYIKGFIDVADALSYASEKMLDYMDVNNLLDVAFVLENNSRRLNHLQEFPAIAYSTGIISEHLHRQKYSTMDYGHLCRLCMFVYDFCSVYLRWVKDVFRDRIAEDIYFMDDEIIGYVMRMESSFECS